MNTLRELFKKPLNAAIAGFVIGLIVGLPILGWGLWPVKWYDAAPAQLRSDAQVDYLTMAIESYNRSSPGDVGLAKARWQELGDGREQVLAKVKAAPGTLSAADIAAFEKAVTGQSSIPGLPTPSTPTGQPEGEGTNIFLLVVLLLALLGVGGVLIWNLFLKKGGKSAPLPFRKGAAPAPYVPAGEPPYPGYETPMAQYMTTYKLGIDLYDDAFSIDSPTGEFLGECGVGISKTVGVGDPKKVTAFEVWLFDKNDIQTVTKVLMSEFAYNNDEIAQELAAKGEPVLLEPGKQILLETASLQLEARVTDMAYGTGALPDKSFLERLSLELAIWPKQPAEG